MGASGLDEDHPPVTDIDNFMPQRNVQVHDETIPEETDEEGFDDMEGGGGIVDEDFDVNSTKEQ
jgi:hypothetical protein